MVLLLPPTDGVLEVTLATEEATGADDCAEVCALVVDSPSEVVETPELLVAEEAFCDSLELVITELFETDSLPLTEFEEFPDTTLPDVFPLSVALPDVLVDVLADVLADVLVDVLADVLVDTLADELSGFRTHVSAIHVDVLSQHSPPSKLPPLTLPPQYALPSSHKSLQRAESTQV